jgi:O-methyltransferase involved in polyketide biosynthesis
MRKVYALAVSTQGETARILKAGPTAAMVVAVGGDRLAFTEPGRALLAMVDTSAAHDLAHTLRTTHPHSLRHLVLRRWRSMRHLERIAAECPAAAQLIIVPGAGLSALGVDWCTLHDTAHAIEIDYDHVDAKRAAICAAAPHAAPRIHLLHLDLRDTRALTRALTPLGWSPATPCTWVIEGLSYYLAHAEFAALLACARGTHPDTRIISEYGGPRSPLRDRARRALTTYHQLIAQRIGMADLHETDIVAVARDAGLRIVIDECAADIESLVADGTRTFADALDSSMHMALLAPV